MSLNAIKVNNLDINYTHSIFDISEYNNATYTDLTTALAAIPSNKQHGGMSIRYKQTSDNMYVQWNLRRQNWSDNIAHWENIKDIINQRTNIFDIKTTNLGWLYAIDGNNQVYKTERVDFGQTAPIKVNTGEIISIYNATKDKDSYFLTRHGSDNINDIIDGIQIIPSIQIGIGSYYEYIVPENTEYISIAYINDRDLWIGVNLRECLNNLKNETKTIYSQLSKVLNQNLFDKDKAYYGWIYIYNGSQIIKLNGPTFGQTYPIEVSEGDIINLHNLTRNTDSFWVTILGSNDIEDTIIAKQLNPFKSIDGGSFERYIVPSGVQYISLAFTNDQGLNNIEIYKNEKVSNNPFIEINALGDSITEGFINSSISANPTWCQIVANNLGCKVNNYGVSATSICNGSSESFVIRLNRMTETWIDCLIIFGGTNDYGDKRALTLGTISDEPSQGTNFYASFKNLILTAIKKYPMAQILVITPMRRQNGSPNQYGISIEDIVTAEIEISKYYGVKCFDFFHEGGINPTITEQGNAYTSDGLHPNQDGINRFLAPRFTMEIEKVITCRG